MVKINTIKGSSIIEVIVSTIVFMITFFIIINTIVRYEKIFPAKTNMIDVETTLKSLTDRYTANYIESKVVEHHYEWGEVIIEIKQLNSELFLIVSTARTKNNRLIRVKRIARI